MAELKTKRNKGDVQAFLNKVADDKKRKDSFTILELMKQVTGAEPEMWGERLAKLGKHTTGKSCLYIKKIDDVNTKVLKELVKKSAEHMGKSAGGKA
jgi:hypothetical protein